MKFSASAASLLLGLPALASAYDIGCIYPPDMPDPFQARYAMHEYSGSYLMHQKIETPVVIHIASISSACQSNCVAYHDDQMLNVLTMERPMVSVPPEYHNSWSRVLCMAQCHSIVSDEAGRPGFFDPYFTKWGLTGIETRKDIVGLAFLTAQQSGDPAPLNQVLEEADYHPFTVGQIVATEILLDVIEDGWNALGNYTYDTETGQEVRCTASCEHYKDTYGYFPKNYPTGIPENETTKYIVEGKDKYWQPLTDSDGNGFFSAQEHVTPHIGFKARSKLHGTVDNMPTAPDPQYDYLEEAQLVVERLRETSSDPIKKQKIAFYDNKLLVINLVENNVKWKYAKDYSFEEEVLYIEGMSTGEYEATVLSWREKVRHDLVRPTTVIKRWGSDVLNTFSGDKGMDGPADIKARDFQAFQRVMPHSEYPSGSSCICTAYSEFTDAYTMEYFNDTLTDVPFGALGEGTGFGCDPTQDPPLLASHGCESDFVIPDMKTLLHECSQSRLWAGFHFTAAVVEGEKLCAGVGVKAFDVIKKVRNGSTFGNKYYQGDPRPQCLSGDISVNRGGSDLESSAKPWSLAVAAMVPMLLFFAM